MQHPSAAGADGGQLKLLIGKQFLEWELLKDIG